MKKNYLLFIFFLFALCLDAQVVSDRRETLPLMSPADHKDYNLAVTDQLGVIGNSFDNPGLIGTAPADPFNYINTHFPVNGYKRTICGMVSAIHFHTSDHYDDDDMIYKIRPSFSSKSLLDDVNEIIIGENLSKVKQHIVNTAANENPFVSLILKEYNRKIAAAADEIAVVNLNSISKRKEYNGKINKLNYYFFAILNQFHVLRTLKEEVEGEIDIHSINMPSLMPYTENVPRQEIDCACEYGPWVHDAASPAPLVGNYHDYYEIHPCEQVWWVNKKNNETIYNLCLFNDNSGRFDKEENYDTDGGKKTNYPWTPKILYGTFAIAFEVRLRQPTIHYTVDPLIQKNTRAINNYGRTTYLIYQSDTLLAVQELEQGIDHIKIEFDKVGIDPYILFSTYPATDTVIKGFLLIKSSIGIPTDVAGNLILNVRMNKGFPSRPPVATLKPIYKVTLERMLCVAVDDGNDEEEIYGYAGVGVYSSKTVPAGITILPSDGNSSLFWSRLDGNAVNLKKGQEYLINQSKSYELDNAARLVIKADLNEDDDNGDNNPTDMDEDDDRLAEKNDFGDNVKERTFYPRDFVSRSSYTYQPVFQSGGTRIRLYFRIEKIGNSVRPAGIIR